MNSIGRVMKEIEQKVSPKNGVCYMSDKKRIELRKKRKKHK
jgi:hypothetical protein